MNALLFGATGMVGIEVLHACLVEPRIARVVSVSRRSTEVSHPKLQEVMHRDFNNFDPLIEVLKECEILFYCLGVYQGRVPEQEFYDITCGYLDRLLRALESIPRQPVFCLHSAVGADPTEQSRVLFARAKGRAERLLTESSIRDYYIFRPGYIAPGRRSGRSRIPDWLALPVYRLIPTIGIDAVDLASVMLRVGLEKGPKRLFLNREIREAVRRYKRGTRS